MRSKASIAGVFAAFLAVLAGCSNPSPPTGRWEGVYDGPDLLVAVRLEIGANGDVRVSAPNAITKEEGLTQADRAELRAKLIDGLAKSWAAVPKSPLEFDGKDFHKPGGVAPQLEWDAKAKQMTMIYYSGRNASVRVPLAAVDDFKS